MPSPEAIEPREHGHEEGPCSHEEGDTEGGVEEEVREVTASPGEPASGIEAEGLVEGVTGNPKVQFLGAEEHLAFLSDKEGTHESQHAQKEGKGEDERKMAARGGMPWGGGGMSFLFVRGHVSCDILRSCIFDRLKIRAKDTKKTPILCLCQG